MPEDNAANLWNTFQDQSRVHNDGISKLCKELADVRRENEKLRAQCKRLCEKNVEMTRDLAINRCSGGDTLKGLFDRSAAGDSLELNMPRTELIIAAEISSDVDHRLFRECITARAGNWKRVFTLPLRGMPETAIQYIRMGHLQKLLAAAIKDTKKGLWPIK